MRRLILNADDLGYDPAVTRGIVEAMTHGVVSSTTLMVNTPSSEDAARQTERLPVGLHLNLTRWESVSEHGRVFTEARVTGLDAGFVERETLAQVDRFHALVGRDPTHVDVHKHLHRHPQVLEGLARAARARKLPVRSIDAAMRAKLVQMGVTTNDAFFGEAETEAYWTLERFRQQLEHLPMEGVVELMCHPGHRPESVQSAYSAQREVELATFTSAEAHALLAAKGVSFVGWTK